MPSFNPKSLWEARPHTLAKIEIVRRYLYLWFSILGTSRAQGGRLIYIDGFAGPGKYSNSDQSSPVAALQAAKAAIEQNAKLRGVEFVFIFVEKRDDFAENLRLTVSARSWPENIKLNIEQGSFEEKIGAVLNDLKRQGKALPPTFALVDPFGATGLPFRVVAEILSHQSCEVLLNLDSDGIGRLITAQAFERNQQNLDTLFGDRSWQQLDPALPMSKLSGAVLGLYKQKLRSLPKVRYVFPFAMNTRHDQINYHLVFASQHRLGLEKMKEAMKKVDQTGTYSFSDDTVAQELLKFNFSAPEEWCAKMQGDLGGVWHPYATFHDYALNETPFVNPKAMLEQLRNAGKVEVKWVTKPAARGFPEEKIHSILILK